MFMKEQLEAKLRIDLEAKQEQNQELKIIAVKKAGFLYLITLLNKNSILCSEQDLFEYQLYNNSYIDENTLDILLKNNSYYLCLNDSIKICSYKLYTSKQVKDKLKLKDHHLNDINRCLDYLIKIKLIDDNLFYENYLEQKTNEGYGPIYISNKLKLLGIYLDVNIDDNIINNNLNKHLELFLKRNSFNKQTKQKFINKMIYKGYSLDQIKNILTDIEVVNKKDDIEKDYLKIYQKYSLKYEGYKLKQLIKQKLLTKGYSLEQVNDYMEVI